jgi:hypothetical protein
MALLVIEGFEGAGSTTGSGAGSTVRDYIKSRYGTQDLLNESTSGSIRLENGWGAGHALSWGGSSSADDNYFDIYVPPLTEAIVGFAIKPRLTYLQDANVLGFYTGTVEEYQIQLRVVGNRHLVCYNDAFNRRNATTAMNVLRPDRWSYVEIRMVMSQTVGEVEIYVNGIQVVNATNIDTLGDSGATFFDTIRFQGNDATSDTDVSEQWLIDDIYVADTSGSVNNTFLGPLKVEALFPTAEGSTIDFTPNAGADNSANVDDNPKDDDTTYNSSTDTASNKDLFTTSNLTVINEGIVGVQITNQALSASGFPVGLQSIVFEGTTQGTGDVIEVSSDTKYLSVQYIFETNPDTASPWSTSEVDAMEIGYEVD